MPTVSIAEQITERGGVQLDQVVAFSADNAKIADLSTSHRDHSNSRRQDFSVHDEAGGVIYHAAHSAESVGGYQPRHRHNMDQIRFMLSGEMTYAGVGYTAGWLGYFPESVFYGPHEWVKPGSFIVVQAPGLSNGRFTSFEQAREAAVKIRELGGTFKEGICTWPDGTKQDGAEAMEQFAHGNVPPTYAPPIFAEPLWMNTASYPWEPTPIGGVSVKRLGLFGAHGPAIQLMQLAPGASIPAGKTDRLVIRFVYEGEAQYGSMSLPSQPGKVASNIAYRPGAAYESLSSKKGASLLSVELKIPTGSLPYLV